MINCANMCETDKDATELVSRFERLVRDHLVKNEPRYLKRVVEILNLLRGPWAVYATITYSVQLELCVPRRTVIVDIDVDNTVTVLDSNTFSGTNLRHVFDVSSSIDSFRLFIEEIASQVVN